jgi:hypothetical protein
LAEALLSALTSSNPKTLAPAKKNRAADSIPVQSPPAKTGRPNSGEVRARNPLKSKGRPGRVPCPGCKKVLPLKEQHRGKTGRCVHCRIKLQVGGDLATLTVVEERPAYTGARLESTAMTGKLPPRVLKSKQISRKTGGKQDDEETLLGEEVFGWRINRKTAAVLTVVLIGVLIASAIFIDRMANQEKEEVVPANKNTE